MICVGIDAGSRAVKALALDAPGLETIGAMVTDQGVQQQETGDRIFARLLAAHGLAPGDVARTVATGYARNLVSAADTTVTEITCHACGVHHRLAEARTVVEIGGQDSKLLRLQADGSVRDFAMNDRCAAGTGRFLEMVADKLEVPLADLGALASRSAAPAAISSMCAVFAETEIIGLLASGTEPKDIIAGVFGAIAARATTLAGPRLEPPVAFTGGVAMVAGMDKALAEAIGHDVAVVPDPQFTGALGAALLAARQCHPAPEDRGPTGGM